MQVFVYRSDLSETNPQVLAAFPDDPVFDRSYLGTDVAVLSLPQNAMQVDSQSRMTTLVSTWRTDNVNQIVNDEAYRRIDESFTDFMQRNALNQTQRAIIQFGSDQTKWEPIYQNVYSLALQGWTYIDSLRKNADSLATNLPVDPTDDANWPTRIPVIYIPPY
jgi:hypothetical protein